ncbi:MAG: hypothetical protein HRU36_03160 [Rickettsiales bacterium]|nr:hypothetical protein [Rickettsiales bacterium]
MTRSIKKDNISEEIEFLDYRIKRFESQYRILVEYVKSDDKVLEIGILKRIMPFLRYAVQNNSCAKKQLNEWQKETLDDMQKSLLDEYAKKLLQATTVSKKLLELCKKLQKTAITKRPLPEEDIRLCLGFWFPPNALPSVDQDTLHAIYIYISAVIIFGFEEVAEVMELVKESTH